MTTIHIVLNKSSGLYFLGQLYTLLDCYFKIFETVLKITPNFFFHLCLIDNQLIEKQSRLHRFRLILKKRVSIIVKLGICSDTCICNQSEAVWGHYATKYQYSSLPILQGPLCTRLSTNVSTTPLRQWGFRQCLPFSWTTLRGTPLP